LDVWPLSDGSCWEEIRFGWTSGPPCGEEVVIRRVVDPSRRPDRGLRAVGLGGDATDGIHALDARDLAERAGWPDGLRVEEEPGDGIGRRRVDTFLQRAAEQGLRIREYTVPAGGSVQCTVAADDNLLIGRLAANLSAANRVDLSFCDVRGVERLRMSDIPVHAGAGSVVLQYPITYAKAAPSETQVARLVTYDDAGAERLLGEYTFHHTRTLPGPGAW